MAVTITQNPQLYTPSDNPVVWVFSSDQTAQANFYFLVEVYISGNLVENHKVYPENGNYAHFNAQSITERYASVIDTNITFETEVNNNVESYIKVIEYYGTTPTAQANATTSTINVFKARLKRKDFVSYDYLDYKLTASSLVGKALTSFPSNSKRLCALDELIYGTFLVDGLYTNISIATYEEGNVVPIQNFSSTATTSTDKVMGFDLSPIAMETLFPTLNLTGIDSYIITVFNGFTGYTNPFTVYIDSSCEYSTKKRLHFLNSLGGIDSFTFGLIGRESTSIESFGYERQFGGFNGSNDWEYSLNEGTVVDYLKKFNSKLDLTSDWLTQDVQNWLSSELYTSPVVWIEEDGELNRVKVTNKGYDKKIQENDMLFQEVVSIELGNDYSVNV